MYFFLVYTIAGKATVDCEKMLIVVKDTQSIDHGNRNIKSSIIINMSALKASEIDFKQ